ncbi:hypothetical protein BU26DRAFT_514800 [Trematosphaeria pertusa]|uniref:DUF7896 domain-containing protein n=1 Tax=Trematosphaeria pertusa TaxID=390896 RepID=A0A6A6IX84_9PLEO|nr:uncharacterized protein BU26DRAFT_514800 [Trematosphaeria pertusa]KAF2254976.1 hypothetical protein BU26DRAFT_514800 [Trematosphaeria pertusa]
MKEEAPTSTSAGTQTSDPIEPAPPKETVVTAPTVDTPTTSPTFQAPGKTPPRRVLRLKCPTCNDYPDGFRSEHELRRHTNRVHRKTRKVWVTIDTSPDKSFLANCKACQTGKRYNECYNAASHLRRMHFHPHKRGERKMSAAEARRGGKPGDLDPPMEVLKANWLREVEEVVGEEEESAAERTSTSATQLQPQPAVSQPEGKAPPTPTTPSTRSMAIDSIVDKVDAS